MKKFIPYTFSTILYAGSVSLLLANCVVWFVVLSEESRTDLTVIYLEVGQADATLIEAPNGNRILIDAGRGPEILESLSEHIPFYDRTIDVIIATHPHADHIGGIVHVLEHFNVDVVIDSGAEYTSNVFEEYRSAVKESGVQMFYARRGMVISLGSGVQIPILFPDRNTYSMDVDMASVWSQVIYKDTRFLFTGDASKNIERYLISLDGNRLESNVLHAGHHGSNTSNGLEFLNTVGPEYVVVSAAKDSQFGHPHEEVVERMEYIGTRILKTFEKGDILFSSDGTEITSSQ